MLNRIDDEHPEVVEFRNRLDKRVESGDLLRRRIDHRLRTVKRFIRITEADDGVIEEGDIIAFINSLRDEGCSVDYIYKEFNYLCEYLSICVCKGESRSIAEEIRTSYQDIVYERRKEK